MRNLLLLAMTLPLMAQAPAPAPAPEGSTPQAPAAQTPAAAAAKPPGESWISGTVDAGWRFSTGVGGDSNTYRSVVNLGEGPKLFGVDLTILPPNHRLADRIDIQAHSWGGDPYNTARIDARKAGLYNFSFDYRNIAYYNFLPSFANPGRTNTALPFLDQYGFDTFRRTTSLQLELFPGHRIIPYVAYDRDGGRGDGVVNFVLQANEYTVPTRYDDHTNQGRGGVRFEFNRWHLTLEEGGFDARNDQTIGGGVFPNLGNRRTPFLGRQLVLTGGAEQYAVSGDGLFSRGLFTANPFSWVDVSAQFLYSQPHSSTHFTQTDSGTLFNSDLPAFYISEAGVIDATAKQPHPSGSVSVELRPFGGRLRILESWMTDRLHDSGSALLVDQLVLTGVTPVANPSAAAPGQPEGKSTATLNAADFQRFVATYNQQELDLLFDVTPMLTLKAGHRYVWGETTAPPSITVQGATGGTSEKGELRRHVALAGVSFRSKARLRATVDYESSPGDRSYFRTSLNDYRKARIMARYEPVTGLRLSASFKVLTNQNPDPAVRFDLLSRDNTFSASWTPSFMKGASLLGDYSRTTTHSSITYLVPNELAKATSDYRENAHSGTLLADVPLLRGKKNPPSLSLGGSFFRSTGSRPTRYYQPLARVAIPVGGHLQFYTEWRWYALSQPFYLYEGFRTHQFVTAIRWSL